MSNFWVADRDIAVETAGGGDCPNGRGSGGGDFKVWGNFGEGVEIVALVPMYMSEHSHAAWRSETLCQIRLTGKSQFGQYQEIQVLQDGIPEDGLCSLDVLGYFAQG